MFSYSNVEEVLRPDCTTSWERPLFMTAVSAGFPSPAESYIEGLMPENDKYQPIEVIESMDFEVWGRVMHAIRTY
jgi:hypothetical protein